MQLDHLIVVTIVFAMILIVVIVAYRRRIKAGVKALGAEFSVEAEGQSEAISSAPSAREPSPPVKRTATASGARSVALGGGAEGANIATGNNNTVGDEQLRKR